MSLAPWRSLIDRALERNPQPVSRYLQLATVRTDNRPANRTVVFRGFLENTDQLQFAIDSRSQKPDQINHQPWAEACWYFVETREQFRIAGGLTLVGADCAEPSKQQAFLSCWQQLSESARSQFAWPHPGEPRAVLSAVEPPPSAPLPNFCLLLLEPMSVDHLELRGEPHWRELYCLNSDRVWSTQAINP